MDRVEYTVSKSNSIVVCALVAAGTCLPVRCIETAVVYSLISQSLHSNVCRRYNTMSTGEGGAISQEVKQAECEANHSPPSSAEVSNGGTIPPLPRMSSWHSA
jgi:hypothetical protein